MIVNDLLPVMHFPPGRSQWTVSTEETGSGLRSLMHNYQLVQLKPRVNMDFSCVSMGKGRRVKTSKGRRKKNDSCLLMTVMRGTRRQESGEGRK